MAQSTAQRAPGSSVRRRTADPAPPLLQTLQRHTSRASISIQVSEPMVKAPSVTNAAKSLMKVSICISRVAIMFLYVRCLFLSSVQDGNSGDWWQLVSRLLAFALAADAKPLAAGRATGQFP